MKQAVVGMIFAMGLGLIVAPSYVGAIAAIDADTCKTNPDAVVCKGKNDNVQTYIKAGVNTLLFLIGVAAVVVIIIGAITYTTSGGEPAHIKKAKDMILYAVVGLVIAFSAYAIVNWVLVAFK